VISWFGGRRGLADCLGSRCDRPLRLAPEARGVREAGQDEDYDQGRRVEEHGG
jgi:hypothetical protein